jgi:Predicted aminoglycoside phosphotransferase
MAEHASSVQAEPAHAGGALARVRNTGSILACLIDHGLALQPASEITLLSGGTQNILMRVADGVNGYVIRRPGAAIAAGAAHSIARETELLRALGSTGVPHPRLIVGGNDDRLGGAFYVMEEVHGFNPLNGLSAAYRADHALQSGIGRAMIDGLVTLGAVDYRRVGLQDFGRPVGFLERQVARWKSQLEGYASCPEWPGAAGLGETSAVAHWLELNRPSAFLPGIMHGDFHIGNVLFHEDRDGIAAIIDWELATIGDPLLDLGWLLATWPHEGLPSMANLDVPGWTEREDAATLIGYYRSRSHRDLGAVTWYTILACFKLGILLEGTFVRSLEGSASPEIGRILHDDAITLFARARHWMDNPIAPL